MRETALIVAVPEAAPLVDAWRERTTYDKPSHGVPPHVTIHYPFVAADDITDEVVSGLRAIFAGVPSFDVVMRGVRRFPEYAYLAPEPPEPFVRMTEAIVTRWPRYPYWEGMFETIVPHLTVAFGDGDVLDRAEADVRPSLPLALRVTEALLIEEVEPDSRIWRVRERFPLGG